MRPGQMRGMVAASAATAMAAVAATGGAAAQARVAGARSDAPVRVGQTDAGPLLVDRAGYTIFMFTRDARGVDRCARIRGCLNDWPAVTTTGTPGAGTGLKRSLLGTIPFRGKLKEVTYAGYPLHTYKFDFGKGSTMNIGNRQFGGSWFGLTPAGKLVK